MHEVRFSVLTVALMSALSCLASGFPVSTQSHSMEQERDNGSIFRRHISMWATGDLSAFDSLIAPEYIGHVANGSRDREGLKARIKEFRRIYPDIEFRVEDQLSSDEKVVTRLSARGTNSRTGARTELMGINISRIVDQKIVEEWATWEIVAK